jgi:hypothetical protein
MKNKLFLAFAATLFAAITIFNLNLAQQEAASDITLAGVEMVAGAWVEADPPSYNCPGGANECVRVTNGNTLHIFYKN